MGRRVPDVKRPLRGPSIGLFGGSFNPAHAGHLHVAMAGLRELDLDQVWWMVSPQNPMKPQQPRAASRAQTVEKLSLPYGMTVSHIESELGTRYTVDLIAELRARYPDRRFVYLMGSDNLTQLPEWRDWQRILKLVPVAVIARPGSSIKPRLGQVARQYQDFRIAEHQAHTLKDQTAPAWTYLTLPMNNSSSTALRARAL